MNDIYYQRVIENTVKKALNAFPSLGITGPRQAGKTTLITKILQNFQYVTFDDPYNIDYFTDDPKGFLKQYNDKIIFDEVQYVPQIFNYIKIAIDQDRHKYGRFILTGSSQFAFVKNITESLAGRIGLLSLLPLQYSELPNGLKDYKNIYKSSYPEQIRTNYEQDDIWYNTYIDTYLTKDIRSLANIGDIRDFRKLIKLLAANTSQLLDYSKYANDIGVAVSTIKRWISILEASYIIFLLPPFHKNFGKRIIKSPKIYFYDTGLVSYLTGIQTFDHYNQGPLSGALFENFIISNIYKNILHTKQNKQLYFLRTSDKCEIDLIIDHHQYLEFIEIKKTHTFKRSFIKTIQKFIQTQDKAYIIYQGENLDIAANIKAISYDIYLDN